MKEGGEGEIGRERTHKNMVELPDVEYNTNPHFFFFNSLYVMYSRMNYMYFYMAAAYAPPPPYFCYGFCALDSGKKRTHTHKKSLD